MHHKALMAFALGLFLSTPVLATAVEVVEGQLSINRGDGYQPVVYWIPASPGNLVMASPNSSGKITYADGCVVEVTPGAVVTVQEYSPCTRPGAGFKPIYVVGGALVVGGVVAGAIALSGGGDDNNKAGSVDDDDPASP